MPRNFKNEYEWEKQKYTKICLKLDKEIAEKLKLKVKENNTNVSAILKEFINDYINNN